MLYSETEQLFSEVNERKQNPPKHYGRRLGLTAPVTVQVCRML